MRNLVKRVLLRFLSVLYYSFFPSYHLFEIRFPNWRRHFCKYLCSYEVGDYLEGVFLRDLQFPEMCGFLDLRYFKSAIFPKYAIYPKSVFCSVWSSAIFQTGEFTHFRHMRVFELFLKGAFLPFNHRYKILQVNKYKILNFL